MKLKKPDEFPGGTWSGPPPLAGQASSSAAMARHRASPSDGAVPEIPQSARIPPSRQVPAPALPTGALARCSAPPPSSVLPGPRCHLSKQPLSLRRRAPHVCPAKRTQSRSRVPHLLPVDETCINKPNAQPTEAKRWRVLRVRPAMACAATWHATCLAERSPSSRQLRPERRQPTAPSTTCRAAPAKAERRGKLVPQAQAYQCRYRFDFCPPGARPDRRPMALELRATAGRTIE